MLSTGLHFASESTRENQGPQSELGDGCPVRHKDNTST